VGREVFSLWCGGFIDSYEAQQK